MARDHVVPFCASFTEPPPGLVCPSGEGPGVNNHVLLTTWGSVRATYLSTVTHDWMPCASTRAHAAVFSGSAVIGSIRYNESASSCALGSMRHISFSSPLMIRVNHLILQSFVASCVRARHRILLIQLHCVSTQKVQFTDTQLISGISGSTHLGFDFVLGAS